jgi:hypothetical protein
MAAPSRHKWHIATAQILSPKFGSTKVRKTQDTVARTARFADEPQPEARKQPPQFGNAAGTGGLADDFDEPLKDFAEYMP